MSAPIEVNAALAQLDQIQAQIENITVSDAKATPAKGGLPTETKDLAWVSRNRDERSFVEEAALTLNLPRRRPRVEETYTIIILTIVL